MFSAQILSVVQRFRNFDRNICPCLMFLGARLNKNATAFAKQGTSLTPLEARLLRGVQGPIDTNGDCDLNMHFAFCVKHTILLGLFLQESFVPKTLTCVHAWPWRRDGKRSGCLGKSGKKGVQHHVTAFPVHKQGSLRHHWDLPWQACRAETEATGLFVCLSYLWYIKLKWWTKRLQTTAPWITLVFRAVWAISFILDPSSQLKSVNRSSINYCAFPSVYSVREPDL